jgi:UDP-3-O-acyl N-acetylglucosamine deacetylase
MKAGRQTTLRKRVSVAGAGVHSGLPVTLTMSPADADSGIVFVRSGIDGQPERELRATACSVTATDLATVLGDESGVFVSTVEHVMAALCGLGVDNCIVEIDGPEAPIMDGSARPFFDALAGAGVVAHGGAAPYLTLQEPVRVEDAGSAYEAYPSGDLVLDVTIQFPHPLIGRQSGRFVITREGFARELAAARTFGFAHEVEELRARGLIRGASLENAVVLDDCGVVGTTLRWPDEFLRHKAMDCVGDLALVGARLRARVVAVRPSHRGTVALVRELTRVRQRGSECTV